MAVFAGRIGVSVPTLRAGDLACSDPDAQGRYESEFEYAEPWLGEPGAFDLDPESLRREAGRVRFRSVQLQPPLAVFEDSPPEDWGRRLMVFERRLPRARQGEPFLLRELGAPGRAELLELAKSWAVRGGADILEQVVDAASSFARVAARLGVRRENIAEIGADIAARAKRIAGVPGPGT